jgi:hypothetical protein
MLIRSPLDLSCPIRLLPILALVLILLSSSQDSHGQSYQKRVDAATQAVEQWFEHLDADDYAATWTQASSLFKSKVTKDQWIQQLKTTHQDIDSLQSRSLVGARYKTKPPRGPEGKYVITQYRTQYGSQTKIETVTMKKDSSKWRMAGYFIKPAP